VAEILRYGRPAPSFVAQRDAVREYITGWSGWLRGWLLGSVPRTVTFLARVRWLRFLIMLVRLAWHRLECG